MSGPESGPVTLGVIVGVHGVRGLVRVKSFTAVPEDVAAYGPLQDEAGKSYTLRVTGRAKGVLLARIDGIDGRNAAEALKGVELRIARDRLPPPAEDEFYHADLIGLRADRVAGGTLGTVVAVQDFGAGELLEIRLADIPAGTGGGRRQVTVLLPFDAATVPEIDLAGGYLRVDPPAGLLEDEGADKAGKDTGRDIDKDIGRETDGGTEDG